MRPDIEKTLKAQLEAASPLSSFTHTTSDTTSPVVAVEEPKILPLKNWTQDGRYCSNARTMQWYRFAILVLLLALCGIVFLKSIHTLILIGFTVLLWQLFFGLSKDPSLVSVCITYVILNLLSFSLILSVEILSRILISAPLPL
jgi:hypothetical protein